MSDQKQLPSLSEIAGKMAADHARASAYITILSDRVDRLVHAATQNRWDEVGRMSQELAGESRRGGFRAVSARADMVYGETSKPNNEIGIKRSLIRLIGTCGRSG